MTLLGNTMSVNTRPRWLATTAVVAAMAIGGSHAVADQPQVRFAVAGEFSLPFMEAMGRSFSEPQGSKNDVDVHQWDGVETVSRFLRDECDVLSVDMAGDAGVPKRLQSAAQYRVGQTRVVVIVHPDNPIRSLKMDELRTTLRDKSSTWRKVTGAGTTNAIEVVSAIDDQSPHGGILRRCMTFAEKVPGGYRRGYYLFRDDLKKLHTPQDAIAQVSRNSKAIGILPLTGTEDVRGVKVLQISEGDDDIPVSPDLGVSTQTKYPLSEDVILLLSPKASPLARRFCEFAVGETGAKVAAQHGIISMWLEQQYIGNQRLKEMQTGKGIRVSTLGGETERTVFQDMAVEYVRSRAVIQSSFAPVDADVASIGAFVTGSAGMRELLLLGDKPSARAMEVHGARWNALGPEGTGPAEHVIAGRAAAVIVNPANKLESLTLGQVQAIFQGDVNDWSVIGSTELTASGRTGPSAAGPGGLRINLFGLGAGDEAAGVFYKECVPAGRLKGVTIKKDTAEAVAAVSMDPQAMAFVDLSAIPTGGQNVKVLAIQVGVGERARDILPTAENIRSAMYPLSQRYFLYVHPQASETAKDFARFVATCGGSEASPYADTVKAVMDTYRKHGLIPLADAAIVRAAKDAMAEAAAKAQAARAKVNP